MTTNKMKLVAMDGEDLQVISTYLQDALTTVGDLKWFAKENRFLLTLNRFVWENETEGKKGKLHERRRSVLHFNLVNSVKSLGLRKNAKDAVLSLLAITFEETNLPEGVINLNFAAGAKIQLGVECLEAQLTDLDGAWTTKNKPDHDQPEEIKPSA